MSVDIKPIQAYAALDEAGRIDLRSIRRDEPSAHIAADPGRAGH